MGMTQAKSLLEVKDGLTFLDIIARQVLGLRERAGAPVPLVLMNSFATRDDSLAALERYPDLALDGLPLDFPQGKVPKLLEEGLEPAEWAADPKLEWAPPGHGDLYPSLSGSGMLDALLERGLEYAFVSNSDNLGATLDLRILAWFAREGTPFLMEAADRTQSDRKGGHLARRPGGGLVLREIAQTPDEDVDSFQDVSRHRYFNTNTIWVNLRALADVLAASGGVIELPMIVNRKTVDPKDSSSPAVVQLETAMGAAIDVFEGAGAVRVPRSRFVPVKATSDLLALRSDAYVLGDGHAVHLAPERDGVPPFIDLDPEHFKLVGQFDERFAQGPPSLVACERLEVVGDVAFGAGVVCRGEVRVAQEGEEQHRVPDGATLGD
jgi:UTP--glucose-1-phosphate uridylyltransferase